MDPEVAAGRDRRRGSGRVPAVAAAAAAAVVVAAVDGDSTVPHEQSSGLDCE
jgi:hypothetical protein